uniref:Uncharacterized protein n=1 Tax=viral metagenome TaxID=1070528 RepID=A0A6M3IVZ0_9ZZZZ
MSIDTVEREFNLAQLIMITEIQNITAEHNERQTKEKARWGKRRNRGRTKDEINRTGFNLL